MSKAAFGGSLVLLSAAALGQTYETYETYNVPAELWDRPRSAAAVAGEDSVKRAVGALLALPDARFVIHHAAGQEPLLQAEELKSWLAALAIDPRRVILRSDLAPGATLKIEVTP